MNNKIKTLPSRQREPIYCMGIEGVINVTPRLFVLDAYNRTPTFITDFSYLNIHYNYDHPSNTTEHSGGVVDISKEDFMNFISILEAKHGVKIFIKTQWGKNEVSQPVNEPTVKGFVAFLRKKFNL